MGEARRAARRVARERALKLVCGTETGSARMQRTRTNNAADTRRARRADGSLMIARADLILDLVKASRQGAAQVWKVVEALEVAEDVLFPIPIYQEIRQWIAVRVPTGVGIP